MRKLLICGALAAADCSAGASPAAAYEGPWCLKSQRRPRLGYGALPLAETSKRAAASAASWGEPLHPEPAVLCGRSRSRAETAHAKAKTRAHSVGGVMTVEPARYDHAAARHWHCERTGSDAADRRATAARLRRRHLVRVQQSGRRLRSSSRCDLPTYEAVPRLHERIARDMVHAEPALSRRRAAAAPQVKDTLIAERQR